MSESWPDALVTPEPKYRPVTGDEATALDVWAGTTGIPLPLVRRPEGLAIVVRGDGAARMALAELDRMRAAPDPEDEPDEANWPGRVLFEMCARYGRPEQAWAELDQAEADEWDRRAHVVWEAHEYGQPTPAHALIWWCRSCDQGFTRKRGQTAPTRQAVEHVCFPHPIGNERKVIVAATWGDRRGYSPPEPLGDGSGG